MERVGEKKREKSGHDFSEVSLFWDTLPKILSGVKKDSILGVVPKISAPSDEKYLDLRVNFWG